MTTSENIEMLQRKLQELEAYYYELNKAYESLIFIGGKDPDEKRQIVEALQDIGDSPAHVLSCGKACPACVRKRRIAERALQLVEKCKHQE